MSDQEALRGALDAVERILNRGGEADDVLRAVVTAIHSRLEYDWVGIRFVEGDALALGPAEGVADGPETVVPITYKGSTIAELAIAGEHPEDRPFLERVAVLISAHCLVGWDTGGERWQP